MADRSRLTVALFVSVLLHALSLGMGTSSWPRQFARPSPPELLDVDLVPFAKVAPVQPPQAVPVPVPQAEPQLLPETQIVSPSAAGEERPPETTNLLSDRDNTVPQEMVRRGSPGALQDQGDAVTFSPGEDAAENAETAAAFRHSFGMLSR